MSELERGRRLLVAAAVMMVGMAVTFHCGIAEAKAKHKNYTINWAPNPHVSPIIGVTLRVNDTIVFIYNKTAEYNVIKVDADGYTNCNFSSCTTVYQSGHDSFELLEKGQQFFICGANNGYHCKNQKMKVAVYVNN